MRYLTTKSWSGYSRKPGRKGQTELLEYSDSITNSTHQDDDNAADGDVVAEYITWSLRDDASVPSMRQKLIDLEVIDELVFEDTLGDKDKTVLRRMTASGVVLTRVSMTVNAKGVGTAFVKARPAKIKWERLTPKGTYTEATWASTEDDD